MATITFKELKSGIVKLITSQLPPEVTGPPPGEGSILDDMDVLAISLDGVGIMLTYCESIKADRAFLFADFGEPPAERELAILRRLMDMNFALYRGGSPSFVRDPDTGHILLMSEILLAMATPEDVFSYIRSLIKQALEWRETYFLPEGEVAAPALGAMA